MGALTELAEKGGRKQTEQGNKARPVANGLRRKENLYIAARTEQSCSQQPAASKASAATAREEASWRAGNGSAERKGSSSAHRTTKKKKCRIKSAVLAFTAGEQARGVNLGPALEENRMSHLVHRWDIWCTDFHFFFFPSRRRS